MTATRAFAALGLGLAGISVIGTVLVRLVAPAPFLGGLGFSGAAMVGYLVAGSAWTSVGALLVVRRSSNVIGWLMVIVGVGYALSQLSVAVTFAFAADSSMTAAAEVAGWITVLLQTVTLNQFAIAFLFPTGQPLDRGWARFMHAFWLFAAAFVAISLFQPGPLQLLPAIDNPFGVGPDVRSGQAISPWLALPSMAILAALVLSMVMRYRSSGQIERLQLRWFLVASGVSAVGLGVVLLEGVLVGREPTVGLAVFVFAGALVPGAIGVAILRHHLFDLDRIISRTIGWALVTGVLIAVFVVGVIALQTLLTDVTQGETLAVAASTLLALALFQPVRQRVQRAVDRRFDRARYDAERTAAAFADRLRDEVDLDTLGAELEQTARHALRPSAASIWLPARRLR